MFCICLPHIGTSNVFHLLSAITIDKMTIENINVTLMRGWPQTLFKHLLFATPILAHKFMNIFHVANVFKELMYSVWCALHFIANKIPNTKICRNRIVSFWCTRNYSEKINKQQRAKKRNIKRQQPHELCQQQCYGVIAFMR